MKHERVKILTTTIFQALEISTENYDLLMNMNTTEEVESTTMLDVQNTQDASLYFKISRKNTNCQCTEGVSKYQSNSYINVVKVKAPSTLATS